MTEGPSHLAFRPTGDDVTDAGTDEEDEEFEQAVDDDMEGPADARFDGGIFTSLDGLLFLPRFFPEV